MASIETVQKTIICPEILEYGLSRENKIGSPPQYTQLFWKFIAALGVVCIASVAYYLRNRSIQNQLLPGEGEKKQFTPMTQQEIQNMIERRSPFEIFCLVDEYRCAIRFVPDEEESKRSDVHDHTDAIYVCVEGLTYPEFIEKLEKNDKYKVQVHHVDSMDDREQLSHNGFTPPAVLNNSVMQNSNY